MSSFIVHNLQDIKEFIEQNREDYVQWLEEQENKRIFIIGFIVISVAIRRITNLEYITYDVRR